MSMTSPGMVAILACNDLPRTRAFYERLGFRQVSGDDHYAMLERAEGGRLHLRAAPDEHIDLEHNFSGVYLYAEAVDDLASCFAGRIIEAKGRPETKPWGTYEFSLSDPDGVLVRVGWPANLSGANGRENSTSLNNSAGQGSGRWGNLACGTRSAFPSGNRLPTD